MKFGPELPPLRQRSVPEVYRRSAGQTGESVCEAGTPMEWGLVGRKLGTTTRVETPKG